MRRWEAIARKAKIWNITMLTHWNMGYGHGSSVTKVTTNSAYSISSHVNIAQIMPHMSWRNGSHEHKHRITENGILKTILYNIISLLPECTTWNHRSIGCADQLLGSGKRSLDHCHPSQSVFVPLKRSRATFIAHVSAADRELKIFERSSFLVFVVPKGYSAK